MYVPPQTGIIPEKCVYWLHTHDENGIIHIESPIKKDFTPGQFFDLWKRKLNNTQVFDSIFNGRKQYSTNIHKWNQNTMVQTIEMSSYMHMMKLH
jgi:hypothetical protein